MACVLDLAFHLLFNALALLLLLLRRLAVLPEADRLQEESNPKQST